MATTLGGQAVGCQQCGTAVGFGHEPWCWHYLPMTEEAYNALIFDRRPGALVYTGGPKAPESDRKATPVYRGFLRYFPNAIASVANCSFVCNEQHQPGEPMRWDRSKSTDELDAAARHMLEAGKRDDDGIRHSTKLAWRALANLQKEIEQDGQPAGQTTPGEHP